MSQSDYKHVISLGIFQQNESYIIIQVLDTSVRGMNLSVQDHPKLSDDSEEMPKPNGMIGISIPNYEIEIVSLLDIKLTKWSSTSCVPTTKKERKS